MPIIIGYMVGKMIGNLIVSIVALIFRLLYLAGIVISHVLKYTFHGAVWLLGKLWDGVRLLYNDYKLNLR